MAAVLTTGAVSHSRSQGDRDTACKVSFCKSVEQKSLISPSGLVIFYRRVAHNRRRSSAQTTNRRQCEDPQLEFFSKYYQSKEAEVHCAGSMER